MPFSKELYIERADFREDPPKKYFRLAPGREVRLRYGYFITCHDVVKDDAGEVVELHCTYDPETRGGNAPDGRKVRGTIHWVSAAHAMDGEVRQYDHLFDRPDPSQVEEGRSWRDNLNPGLARDRAPGLQARTVSGLGETRRALPVRAQGILLRRHAELDRGAPGVQPHRHAARHLGQDQKKKG